MANIASARKRARQSDKRRKHNNSLRSSMRTAVKKAQAADPAAAPVAIAAAEPLLDRMANKGIIHPNKAARQKSRLHKRLKAVAAK